MATYSAQEIRKDALVSNLARLFQIVTNTFGLEKAMNKLDKLEGKEVQAYFPKLGGRYATLKVSNGQIYPLEGRSAHSKPAATITFNIEKEQIVPIINEVIRSKATIGGLLRLVFKYLLPGKIKVKGSYGVAIKILKVLMIGNHPMYARERELAVGGAS